MNPKKRMKLRMLIGLLREEWNQRNQINDCSQKVAIGLKLPCLLPAGHAGEHIYALMRKPLFDEISPGQDAEDNH